MTKPQELKLLLEGKTVKGGSTLLFFLIFLNLFIFGWGLCLFWHWVFFAAHGLSLVAVSGGCSLLWFLGFSLQCLLLWSKDASVRASVAAACGLNSWDTPALWPVESSQTRDWTRVPCTDRRIPAHCTTREVQHCFTIPRKSHDGLKYFPLHLLSLTNPLSDLKKIFSRTILRFCFDLFLDEILWEKEIFSFFFLKQ